MIVEEYARRQDILAATFSSTIAQGMQGKKSGLGGDSSDFKIGKNERSLCHVCTCSTHSRYFAYGLDINRSANIQISVLNYILLLPVISPTYFSS